MSGICARNVYGNFPQRGCAPLVENIWNIHEHARNICFVREHFGRNIYYSVDLYSLDPPLREPTPLRDPDRLEPRQGLRERPLRYFPYVNDPQIAFWRLRDGTAPGSSVLLMVVRDMYEAAAQSPSGLIKYQKRRKKWFP